VQPISVARAKIRVAICDDHPFFREGLKKVIHSTPDLQVVVEADSGPHLIDQLRTQPVDVLILDLSLPGRDGMEIIKDLRPWGITTPVLVLSAHEESRYAVRALRAGAAGYLNKGADVQALFEAVRKLAGGHCYITGDTADRLAGELIHPTDRPAHDGLSDREYQILLAFASGKGVKEIAAGLNLSPSTVGTYRSRVLSKLNLDNNADLVRYAVLNGLVE
jgi:DNA-binding NarL/FixJ family response regulator